MANLQWLDWAQRLQAIAQTGLAYTKDVYDEERFVMVRRIAAEMMAEGAGLTDADRVVDLLSGDVGYATPKVDVRGAVFHGDKLLFVRQRGEGVWTLPGGWADVGDSPSAAVIREVREESGYEVVTTKLAAVYDRNLHGHTPMPFYCYKLFFVCRVVGGAAAESHETDGVGFFGEEELPELSITRVTPKQIAHMFGHYRNPEWATSVD